MPRVVRTCPIADGYPVLQVRYPDGSGVTACNVDIYNISTGAAVSTGTLTGSRVGTTQIFQIDTSTITGTLDLAVQEAGEYEFVFVPTAGGTPDSETVEVRANDSEHTSAIYDGAIWIDVSGGAALPSAGTYTYGYGSAVQPLTNLVDAETVSGARGELSCIKITGQITGANGASFTSATWLRGFNILGISADATIELVSGANMDLHQCRVENVNLGMAFGGTTGGYQGRYISKGEANFYHIYAGGGADNLAYFVESTFDFRSYLTTGADFCSYDRCTFNNCTLDASGIATGSSTFFPGCRGTLTVSNMTDATSTFVFSSGENLRVVFDATCTGGIVQADGLISIDVSAATGMTVTTQPGFTNTRVANLDNLDALVSSRAATGAAMTLTAGERTAIQALIVSDATPFAGANVDAAISSRAVAGDAMALTAAAVDAIWDELTAGHAVAGSFAEAVTDILTDTAAIQPTVATNLDAQISGVNTSLTAIQGATFDTLTDSLEAIRNRGDAAWITGGGGGSASIADKSSVITCPILEGYPTLEVRWPSTLTPGAVTVSVYDLESGTPATALGTGLVTAAGPGTNSFVLDTSAGAVTAVADLQAIENGHLLFKFVSGGGLEDIDVEVWCNTAAHVNILYPDGCVHVDTGATAPASTAFPAGSTALPCTTPAELAAVVILRSPSTIVFEGTWGGGTLTAAAIGTALTGTRVVAGPNGGTMFAAASNDIDVTDTQFEGIELSNHNTPSNFIGPFTMTGGRIITRLNIGGTGSRNGQLTAEDVLIEGDVNLVALGLGCWTAEFTNCVFNGTRTVDYSSMGSSSTVYTGCTGSIVLASITGGAAVTMLGHRGSGDITVDASSTSGSLTVGGAVNSIINNGSLTITSFNKIFHRADYTLSELIASGGSTTVVNTNATEADGFWDGHRLRIANAAGEQVRTIISYANASGAFTLDRALPFTPASGDEVLIEAESPSALTVPTVDTIWDELTAGHTTPGSFAVAVTDILTDTAAMQPSVAAIDTATAYGGAIRVSSSGANPGTVVGVNGTINNPSDSWDDANTLRGSAGINKIIAAGEVTLAASAFFDSTVLEGAGGFGSGGFNYYGAGNITVSFSSLSNLILRGRFEGPASFDGCNFVNGTNWYQSQFFSGSTVTFKDCLMGTSVFLDSLTITGTPDADVILDNCSYDNSALYTLFPAASTVTLLGVRDYVNFTGDGNGPAVNVVLAGGTLNIGQFVLLSTITISGYGRYTQHASSTATVVTTDFVDMSNLDAAVSSRAATGDAMALTAAAIDAVWDEPIAGHLSAGSTGEALNASGGGLTASAIADAVWDEALAGHLSVGSTGEALNASGGGATPAAIADAVWDELTSGHAVVGSFAEAVTDILADTAAIQPTVATNLDAAVSTRAAPGDAMDLVTDAVDAAAVSTTAVSEIQAGLATSAEITALNNLSQAEAQAASAAAIAAASPIAANVTQVAGVAVSGVADFRATGFAVAGDAMDLTAAAVDSIWDEATAGHATAGSFAEAVVSVLADTAAMQPLVSANLDAAVSSRPDSAAVQAAAELAITAQEPIAANVTQVAGAGVVGVADFRATGFATPANVSTTQSALEARFDGVEGGGFDTLTDSLEAIRNRGDAAWTTSVGAGLTQQQVRDAMQLAATGSAVAGSVDTLLADILADTAALDGRVPASPAAAGDVPAAAAVATAVRDIALSGSASGSLGEGLLILMGVSGLWNVRLDNFVYDSNGFLTSARARVFPDPATAAASTAGGTGEGEIFTRTLSGVVDLVHALLPSTVLGVGS